MESLGIAKTKIYLKEKRTGFEIIVEARDLSELKK
jgi:hypothetical protein